MGTKLNIQDVIRISGSSDLFETCQNCNRVETKGSMINVSEELIELIPQNVESEENLKQLLIPNPEEKNCDWISYR